MPRAGTHWHLAGRAPRMRKPRAASSPARGPRLPTVEHPRRPPPHPPPPRRTAPTSSARMADDGNTPAAAAYHHACRLLAVSPRPDCRALLARPALARARFAAAALSFPDEHALALAAGLLVAHSASWPLVRRFLRTYLCHASPQSLPSFDTLAVSPFTLLHPPANTPPPPPPPPPPATYVADFSFNSQLTSEGAAAIVAACLLIPRPIRIDLFLNVCTNLSSLPLAPWLPLLHVERNRPERHNACALLTGLCLDACPVRTFDPQALTPFSSLSWISLRSTRISNLWRTAEILDALPSLSSALLSGNLADHHALEATRHCSTETDTRRHHLTPFTSDHIPSRSLPSTSAKTPTGTEQNPLPRLEMYNLMNAAPTPVTTHPHYRIFLLSASRTPLRVLDAKSISATERQRALISFRKHFEHPMVKQPQSKHTSISQLLKNREAGLSPRASHSTSLFSQRERPQKRRRTASQAQPVTDIMAAVAAAGFPTGNGISRLSPATSLTVALAATTSAEKNTDRKISENLRRVREAAITIQNASERERLSMLASRWMKSSGHQPSEARLPPRRNRLSGGVSVSREDGFERSLTAALISRRGNPRVQYFCQGTDRPRQFEFNPANPSELVYGTEHGYLVVMDELSGVVKGSCVSGGGAGNRPTGTLIRRTSSLGSSSAVPRRRRDHRSHAGSGAVYGLSWLNTTSNLFISGVDSGAIHLYDVNRMGNGTDDGCRYACETFDRLTSIHVSSDDVRFAVSGRTCDVGLFDLETGKRLETMADCHNESINVIKFAHHSPHVLLTSSFDRCVKKWDLRESRPGGGRRPIFTTVSHTDNVMACFSPDDEYLLVSSVDNEVRQYTACDGRLERDFRIPRIWSDYNFTRSYYMNDRDYIVTGSCQESVVRVYNSRTGAFFAEVDMDSRESSDPRNFYVQTLRSNPSRRFNFSAILASQAGSANEMIASVDLHSR